jgi:hypothetical protein
MPSFSTEVDHTLGQEQATERLKGFVTQVGERYKDQVSQMDGEWIENVLKFALTTYGFNISGALTVEEKRVLLKGDLPFAAMMFRGKIEQSIADELRKALT